MTETFSSFKRNFSIRPLLAYTPLIPYLVLILSAIPTTAASPIPSRFTDWLHGELLPEPGVTLGGEIKCYNLPYGGIGFTSHVLTYYTVVTMLLGRTPIFPRPFDELKHYGWDIFLSIIGIIGTVTVTGLNISACRNRWQFVCIGVWKLTMSFTLCSITWHQSVAVDNFKTQIELVNNPARRREYYSRTTNLVFKDWKRRPVQPTPTRFEFRYYPQASFWLILYFVGTVIGMTGLMSLVMQLFSTHSQIRIITGIFASVAFLPLFIWFLVFFVYASVLLAQALAAAFIWLFNYLLYFTHLDDSVGSVEMNWKTEWNIKKHEINFEAVWFGFAYSTAIFGLFGAFYCDWVLASIAGNWAGLPSSDTAVLYWIYFASKRLPMLST
ncbi:uncharacterized protein LY89DRAFT_781865 [Mollisia scopiformis]|uniref:Uncharacterized protein n=1 Tax=Mollisia scopiformis TaxID=149040 RepID=A0A194XC36_MOLSC|nr:uncharacterized protein LY89DRAFT_781865 [Mollisia scopiformis]KUJ17721.1 hypothetical protein LY89DRAFT_781865 [Mollisia scopiformis]